MKEYLKGIHFYEIYIRKYIGDSYRYRVCTYREQDKLEEIFDNQKQVGKISSFTIVEIDHDWLVEDEHYFFPMDCVELKNTYNDLEELIQDIMVGKLAGILDVDIDFGVTDDK